MELEEEEEEGRQEGLFHSGENEENGNKQKRFSYSTEDIYFIKYSIYLDK